MLKWLYHRYLVFLEEQDIEYVVKVMEKMTFINV